MYRLKPYRRGVFAVIAKQAKQRQESIEEFKKACRTDLADKEAAELKILEESSPRPPNT